MEPPNYYHPKLAHETPAQVAQRMLRLKEIEYERRCLCVTLLAEGISFDTVDRITAPLTEDLRIANADCRHALAQFAADRHVTKAELQSMYDDPHWTPF
jgi:hypothetical protein